MNGIPGTISIDTLVVTAPSAIDARRLADALPAAITRALDAAPGRIAMPAERLDAGDIRSAPGAPELADRIATQIVAAALPEQRR